MSGQSDLQLINGIIATLDSNRVARFGYTGKAFDDNDLDGVDVFNLDAENNIPKSSRTDYNERVLDKGIQAQGASVTRNGWNHFTGRASMNLNKLVQKFREFLGVVSSVWAHNAFEYDSGAKYAYGDVCYVVEVISGVRVFTYYQRVSQSPVTISGIPPAVGLHWTPMQNKTSTSALLPFKAPGYQHKYSIIDLTSGFVPATWYPVITTVQDFDAQAGGTKEGVLDVLIEAYCNGPVSTLSGNYRAELAVISRFTGFANTSTDMVVNSSFINTATGVPQSDSANPIGYSKLPKGRQAVVWLKGGGKYALWNSFGSLFTLVTGEYNNNLDPVLTPVNQRPFEIIERTVRARLQTPDAVLQDEAVNLRQVAGSIPSPKTLGSGAQLDSVRTPGVYVADTAAIANTIGNVPVADPGAFELTVKGDKGGLSITTQRFIQRGTGKEYIRVLTGTAVTIPWYLASSPDGIYIEMQGLYAFQIDVSGHLILHYQAGTDIPAFHIDGSGHLIADVA